MPRRLAQLRTTLSDLEWLKSTSSASRSLSAVAELLVCFSWLALWTFSCWCHVHVSFRSQVKHSHFVSYHTVPWAISFLEVKMWSRFRYFNTFVIYVIRRSHNLFASLICEKIRDELATCMPRRCKIDT